MERAGDIEANLIKSRRGNRRLVSVPALAGGYRRRWPDFSFWSSRRGRPLIFLLGLRNAQDELAVDRERLEDEPEFDCG
jgi:hypothetical protein